MYLLRKAARQLQGRTEVAGMKVSIENRRASVRQWKNPDDGSEGMTRMSAPYGYFTNGTLGADGDALDVYVGPHREEATHVYVIHQKKAPDFVDYDEDKVMAGWLSQEEAIEAYLKHYNDPRFLGPVTAIPVEEFKERALARRGKMLKSVDPEEFNLGMEEEKEHDDITGGDNDKIKKIVLAHLKEDPKYYTKIRAALEKSFRVAHLLRKSKIQHYLYHSKHGEKIVDRRDPRDAKHNEKTEVVVVRSKPQMKLTGNMGNMRKQAVEWVLKNVARGDCYNNHTGLTLQVVRVGIKESASHAYSERELQALSSIRQVIRHAVLFDISPHDPPKDRHEEVYTFYGILKQEGQVYLTKVTAKKISGSGKLFYDQQSVEIVTPGVTQASNSHSIDRQFTPPPGVNSVVSLHDLVDYVKAFHPEHVASFHELHKSQSHQKTICVDFDGVIADYSNGFQGANVFGDPLPGAAEAMRRIKEKGWKIIIFTTRKDTAELRNYLYSNKLVFDEINSNSEQPELSNHGKPIADAYLDDRAVRFENWEQATEDLNRFVKSLVHGHFREESSGKKVYIPDYSDKRTAHVSSKEIGRIPAGIPGTMPLPIRLTPGKQIADHKGWGLEHIHQQHGEEIKAAGYKDEMAFVEDVIQNYNAIYRIDSKKIAIVRDSGAGQKIHVVELREEQGQKFYSIVTAYIADRAKFSNRTHTQLYRKVQKSASDIWELIKARGHEAFTRRAPKSGKLEFIKEKAGDKKPKRIVDLPPGITGKSEEEMRAIAKDRGIAIPPAWTDIWVNADPHGSLQARGKDAGGEWQRRYSSKHTDTAKVEKFARVKEFAKAYPAICKQCVQDFDKRPEARVLYLISKTAFRLGGDEERGEVAAYGASTLRAEHVTVNGNTIHFKFGGKCGVGQDHKLTDKRMADYLRNKKRGKLFDVTQNQIRKYLKDTGHGDFLVKDFRTYIANDVALDAIEKMPEPKDKKSLRDSIKAVCMQVAKKLGNEWTMAKSSYISPEVFSSWNQVTA